MPLFRWFQGLLETKSRWNGLRASQGCRLASPFGADPISSCALALDSLSWPWSSAFDCRGLLLPHRSQPWVLLQHALQLLELLDGLHLVARQALLQDLRSEHGFILVPRTHNMQVRDLTYHLFLDKFMYTHDVLMYVAFTHILHLITLDRICMYLQSSWKGETSGASIQGTRRRLARPSPRYRHGAASVPAAFWGAPALPASFISWKHPGFSWFLHVSRRFRWHPCTKSHLQPTLDDLCPVREPLALASPLNTLSASGGSQWCTSWPPAPLAGSPTEPTPSPCWWSRPSREPEYPPLVASFWLLF